MHGMLRVIDLPEESAKRRGLHHGEELKHDVQELRDAWLTKVGRAPDFLVRKALVRRFMPYVAGIHRSEMNAIAEAANVPRDFVYLVNCFDDLFRVFLQRKHFWQKLSAVCGLYLQQCSGFAFKNNWGNWCIAINQDYGLLKPQIKYTRIFRHTFADENSVPFLSVAFAGYIGVFRGMNKNGIALGYLTSHAKDVRRPGNPFGLFLRQTIGNAHSGRNLKTVVNELTRWSNGYRTIGSNVLICDRENPRVLELSVTDYAIRDDSGYDPLVVTNHPLTERMKPYYLPERYVHGSESTAHQLSPEYSRSRFCRVEKLLKQEIPQSPEEARRVLADDDVCNDTTLRTNIFDPAIRAVWSAVLLEGDAPPVAKGKLVPTSI